MMNDANFPTQQQLDKLLERLLPANEDMDEASASIILEQQGVDRARLASALKSRLEAKVKLMHERGETIPPDLLKIISKL
jgi:hypothetical protein